MDAWLAAHLVCPRDRTHLRNVGDELECDSKHSYPCVTGIPVLLTHDLAPTLPNPWLELDALHHSGPPSVQVQPGEGVDPFVQEMVAATSGYLYEPLVGRLKRIPIPNLRLPTSRGERLLDFGCNWGRWTVSAARLGYQPVGLDPQLSAALAATRVADQLGVQCAFVVGDGRSLPFADHAFDHVFSYSVIQHFSKTDGRLAIGQIARVLRSGGQCMVQMPNKFGVRSLQHQTRLWRRPVGVFDVRYWSPRELLRTFTELVGPARLSVDGYFGLGVQPADIDLLPIRYQLVVRASEWLRSVSKRHAEWLLNVADSLYVEAVRSN